MFPGDIKKWSRDLLNPQLCGSVENREAQMIRKQRIDRTSPSQYRRQPPCSSVAGGQAVATSTGGTNLTHHTALTTLRSAPVLTTESLLQSGQAGVDHCGTNSGSLWHYHSERAGIPASVFVQREEVETPHKLMSKCESNCRVRVHSSLCARD